MRCVCNREGERKGGKGGGRGCEVSMEGQEKGGGLYIGEGREG